MMLKYYLSAYPNETIATLMKRTTIAILKLRRHLKRFLENIIIITRNIRIFFSTGSNANPTLKRNENKIVLFNRMGVHT